MKPSVLLYREWRRHISMLSMEQRGALLTAIFDYDGTDSAIPADPVVAMAFSFMATAFDADEVKYNARAALNKSNGKKGGRPENNPDGSFNNQNNPDGYSETQNNQSVISETERLFQKPKKPVSVSVSVSDSVSGSDVKNGGARHADKPRSASFVPPTLDEVSAFVAERQSPVDPQEFIDFYASKGWLVGKTSMKDWRAACRNAEKWETWDRRCKTAGSTPYRGRDKPAPPGDEREKIAKMQAYLREIEENTDGS